MAATLGTDPLAVIPDSGRKKYKETCVTLKLSLVNT